MPESRGLQPHNPPLQGSHLGSHMCARMQGVGRIGLLCSQLLLRRHGVPDVCLIALRTTT